MWQKKFNDAFQNLEIFEGERDILSSIFAFWHEKDAGSCIADNP
jgi:hypothetical protein